MRTEDGVMESASTDNLSVKFAVKDETEPQLQGNERINGLFFSWFLRQDRLSEKLKKKYLEIPSHASLLP